MSNITELVKNNKITPKKSQIDKLENISKKMTAISSKEAALQKEFKSIKIQISQEEKVRKMKQIRNELKQLRQAHSSLTDTFNGAMEVILSEFMPGANLYEKMKQLEADNATNV